MLFYNIIYILILILTIVSLLKRNKKSQKLVYYFITFLLFILSFIRWETGTDWENYFNTFKYATSITNIIAVEEIGFRFLNFIIRSISENYTIFLFFTSIILYSFKYPILYKLSEIPILTIFMTVSLYLGDIFYVRQAIAGAIILFSLKYIFRKEFFKFLIFIIMSTLIHNTAIIFLPAYYIINYINFNKKKYIIFFILSIAVSMFIQDILVKLSLFFPDNYSNRINYYLLQLNNNFNYKNGTDKIKILISASLNRIFLLSVFYSFRKKVSDKIIKLFELYYFGSLLFIIFTPLSFTFGRIVYYYDLIQLLIYPSLYKYINNKYNKLIFLILFFTYCYLKYKVLINTFYPFYIPYRTILCNFP